MGVIGKFPDMLLGGSYAISAKRVSGCLEVAVAMVVFQGIVDGRTEPQRGRQVLGAHVALEVGRPRPGTPTFLEGYAVAGSDD
jgi:hypothetical protein